MRCTWTLVMVLAVLASSSAVAGMNFTYPEQINILERWNPDGSYGYAEEGSRRLSTAQLFRPYNAGLYGWLPDEGITAKVIFDVPVTLDHLVMQWRDRWDHVPDTWAIYDQNGLIASGSRGTVTEFVAAPITYNVWADPANPGTPRAPSTYLEIVTSGSSDGGAQNVKYSDMIRFEAYLPVGSTVVMDGTFNIFREEVAKNNAAIVNGLPATMTTNAGYLDPRTEYDGGDRLRGDVARLTTGAFSPFDCGQYWVKPPVGEGEEEYSSAGWIEWTLSQPYTLVGAQVMKFDYNAGNQIKDFMLKIYDDEADDWVTVFAQADMYGGYVVFRDEEGLPVEVTGSKVLMSWGDIRRGGGVEITEFQLFGRAIPEPATMSLLALGGLALRRRRR